MKAQNESLIDNIAKALKESELLRPPMSLGLTPGSLNARLRTAIAKGLEPDPSAGRRPPVGVKL